MSSGPNSQDYNIILGTDIFKKMGARIDFSSRTINWMNVDLQMKSVVQSPIQRKWEAHCQQEENEDYSLLFKTYADDILIKDRKYQAVSPEEVVLKQCWDSIRD